jgi:FMN-dependent NADH-azoreductase
MSTLLQIKTSIFGDDGQSSRLADEFVAVWRDNHPGSRVLVRDLAAEPVPHLDAATARAFFTPAEKRDASQQARADYSDRLIDEVREADVLVLGLPMYNFGVPSTLKAWFDHIARAGITFRYTERGPRGLLGGRKAYVLAARGGRYRGTPADTQTGYVRDFLNFIGIVDVEFIYAEGLNMGEESQQAGLGEARKCIRTLAA